jgi:hypothetical protein
MALFIWLIIRLFRLVFSAGTVFFSHKKSANSVFQPAYNSSRTAPMSLQHTISAPFSDVRFAAITLPMSFMSLFSCINNPKSKPKKCYSTYHIKSCGTCMEY